MIDFLLFTAIVGFFVVVGVALASPYFSFGLLALCFLMSAASYDEMNRINNNVCRKDLYDFLD